MSSTSINVGEFGINSVGSDSSLLTARPDMRIVKLGFLAAASIAVAGAVVYMLPVSDSVKAAFLPLAGLFVVTLAYSAIMYETLGNALFTITKRVYRGEGRSHLEEPATHPAKLRT